MQHAKEHRGKSRTLLKKELQTIRTLIEPILDALGWDTRDPARVSHEYSAGSGQVDMALFDKGKAIAFLEAKKLSVSFSKSEREQISRYCFHESVPTAILTNGAEWQIYRPLLINLPFEQRLLFNLDLTEVDAEAAAETLSLLARDEIHALEAMTKRIWLDKVWVEFELEKHIELLVKPLRKRIPVDLKIQPREIRAFLREKLTDAPAVVDEPTPAPAPAPIPASVPGPTSESGRAIILQSRRIAVSRVYEILTTTANWLIERNHIRPEDCPIPYGRSEHRYLIHKAPFHANGKEFVNPHRLQNGLILETHAGRKQAVMLAAGLLAKYGYPESTIQIEGFDDTAPGPTTKPKPAPAPTSDSGRAITLHGRRIAVLRATEILITVASWLVETGKLRRADCPIKMSKTSTRYLVHTEPQHPSGRPFFQKTELPGRLYLERHGSKQEVIRLAYALLERYGYPRDTLRIIGFD